MLQQYFRVNSGSPGTPWGREAGNTEPEPRLRGSKVPCPLLTSRPRARPPQAGGQSEGSPCTGVDGFRLFKEHRCLLGALGKGLRVPGLCKDTSPPRRERALPVTVASRPRLVMAVPHPEPLRAPGRCPITHTTVGRVGRPRARRGPLRHPGPQFPQLLERNCARAPRNLRLPPGRLRLTWRCCCTAPEGTGECPQTHPGTPGSPGQEPASARAPPKLAAAAPTSHERAQPTLSHHPGPTRGLCCPGQLEAISEWRAGGGPCWPCTHGRLGPLPCRNEPSALEFVKKSGVFGLLFFLAKPYHKLVGKPEG